MGNWKLNSDLRIKGFAQVENLFIISIGENRSNTYIVIIMCLNREKNYIDKWHESFFRFK
jgi:hypothetical protein